MTIPPHAVIAVSVAGGAALLLALLTGGTDSRSLEPWQFATGVAAAVLAYVAGRLAPPRWVLVLVVPGAVVGLVRVALSGWPGVTVLLVLALTSVLPWAVGLVTRQRLELIAVTRTRLQQSRQLLELTAERTRWEERSRVLAEVHDGVGHELALIALQAGGLEVDPALTDAHRAAASAVRRSASRGTALLQETLAGLDPVVTGATDSDDLADVVAAVHARGVAVHWTGPSTTVAVPPLAGRVLTEALTNAVRHAPGAPVEVMLTRHEHAVRLEVSNPVVAGIAPSQRVGRGLIGLASLVEATGGRLRSGVVGDRFVLTADLPDPADP